MRMRVSGKEETSGKPYKCSVFTYTLEHRGSRYILYIGLHRVIIVHSGDVVGVMHIGVCNGRNNGIYM